MDLKWGPLHDCYSERSMTMGRRACLEDLVRCVLPISQTVDAVRRFAWDSESDLVILTRAHCIAVLDRFLAGELSAEQVEAWADALECREDVGHETSMVGEVIHALASPAIHGALTAGLAEDLRRQCASGVEESGP